MKLICTIVGTKDKTTKLSLKYYQTPPDSSRNDSLQGLKTV